MVSRQKKTREPADAAGTIAKGYRKIRKHTAKIRKLASLMDGGA